jgi:hypothetical protein
MFRECPRSKAGKLAQRRLQQGKFFEPQRHIVSYRIATLFAQNCQASVFGCALVSRCLRIANAL